MQVQGLDPALTLHVPPATQSTSNDEEQASSNNVRSVSSVCFLPTSTAGEPTSTQRQNCSSFEESDDDDDDDDDDDIELSFRCNKLQQTILEKNNITTFMNTNCKLATCHVDGTCYIWDLNQSKIHFQFGFPQDRKLGMTLRRLDDEGKKSSLLLYQTRDPNGTVSIHDTSREMKATTQFETNSVTFCAACPCLGDPNLLALPSAQETHATIRDHRMPPSDTPAFHFHGAGVDHLSRRYGMLTSVAMSTTPGGWENSSAPSTSGLALMCGMENGSLHVHDLAMPPSSQKSNTKQQRCVSNLSLGTDPILSLDVSPSPPGNKNSFVAVAGLGGDEAELEAVDPTEKGRVVIVKSTMDRPQQWTTRERARVGMGSDGPLVAKKSGVSICRMRSGDGRLIAAGGWDHRLRIYDRSGAKLLAVLRGHNTGVDTMDWAPDSEKSGLLATGGSDGVVNIWKCFESKCETLWLV